MNEGSRDFVANIVTRFYLNMMEPKVWLQPHKRKVSAEACLGA
jgi:hypothetical protein